MACISAFLLLATSAHAATLNVNAGQLIGAFNVSVGGSLYDVQFVEGTCAGLFGGCNESTDFTFTSFGAADLASQALLAQVFLDGPLGAFDSQPNLIAGCANVSNCEVYTAYDFLPGTTRDLAIVSFAQNHATSDGVFTGGGVNIFRDTTSFSQEVWAVWTPVPEPTTALLVTLGLGGLALSRRRSHPLAQP